MGKIKILFVSKPNSENFIKNYSDFTGELLVTRDPSEVHAADQSGKYTHIIFEWANDFTALCLDRPFNTKVIVRVHDHEVRKNRIDAIKWGYVDKVWFINKEIQKQFLARYNKPSFFLPNAVDPRPFKENQTNNKTIGLLCISARTRKRLDRAIALMHLLPDWTLTIRTEMYNEEAGSAEESSKYIRKLLESAPGNVIFNWRDPVFVNNGYGKEDVNEFFSDKDIVLSTSEHEAFHYTICEGAFCGCLPVVFDWEFGDPYQFWQPFVCNSLEAMAEAISNYYPSGYFRHYALQNYAPDALMPRLIEELKK